jgi:hypothetical protein
MNGQDMPVVHVNVGYFLPLPFREGVGGGCASMGQGIRPPPPSRKGRGKPS